MKEQTRMIDLETGKTVLEGIIYQTIQAIDDADRQWVADSNFERDEYLSAERAEELEGLAQLEQEN